MKNEAQPNKRIALIGAILNNDKEKLQQLSQTGKQVVIIDSFLDGLKYSSMKCKDDSVELVFTENFKSMWHDIQSRTATV